MSRSRLIAVSVFTFLCGFVAAPGRAEGQAPECASRWFPDFTCDRAERFDGFVAPMTMPYYFEDPFVTTGVSAHLIWHEFPNESAFQGGDAWIVAVQARVAITDRLAFIATKDGLVIRNPDDDSQLDGETGFFDIAAGLKYALVVLPERDFILTPSFRLELPTGNDEVFAGNGAGQAIPGLSAGWGNGDLHVLADLGARLPFEMHEQSTSLYYNLHLDYAFWRQLVPFVELNGLYYSRSGNGELEVDTDAFGKVDLTTAQDVLFAAGITDRHRWEGADVLNLGSEGVAGNHVVTLAVGARVPLGKRISLGAAYEFPLTHREEIFDQRASLNLLVEL